MLWGLVQSFKYYAKNYHAKYPEIMLKAIEKNIELIIPIRHRIEHRSMPPLDADLGSHCQSMLMNFEALLVCEFTPYYSLNASLTLALQFSTQRSIATVTALRRFQNAEYDALKKYINDFEAGLPDEIFGNPAYAFRVYLIPKPARDARKSDISIEYIKIDPNDPGQLAELAKLIVAIKDREVLGDPSKFCTLWESEAIAALRVALGQKVFFGEKPRPLTAPMLRDIISAYSVPTPSRKYYRPEKQGSRAQYGQELIDWICKEYESDSAFFYKANQTVKAQKARQTVQRVKEAK